MESPNYQTKCSFGEFHDIMSKFPTLAIYNNIWIVLNLTINLIVYAVSKYHTKFNVLIYGSMIFLTEIYFINNEIF